MNVRRDAVRKLQFFYILVTFGFYSVKGDCDLRSSNISADQGIFLVSRHPPYGLLLNNVLQTNQTVYRMCKKVNDLVAITCDAHSVLQPSHLPACRYPAAAVVETLPLETGCPPNVMHAVGFNVNGSFLEMYRTCVDATTYSTSFTVHHLVEQNRNPYNFSTFFSTEKLGQHFGTAYKQQNITDYFQKNLNSYRVDRNRILLNRGHLVAAGDFYFFSQKHATYKLINVVPQFANINGGNWERIEIYLRGLARNYGDVKIITGSSNVLRLQSHLMYLYNNNQLRVPKWTFKVVISSTQTIVFLTSNNIFTRESRPNFCRHEDCPSDFVFPQNKAIGLIYCCKPREFLAAHRHLQAYWGI